MGILLSILFVFVAISIFQINGYLYKILKELKEIKLSLVVEKEIPTNEE